MNRPTVLELEATLYASANDMLMASLLLLGRGSVLWPRLAARAFEAYRVLGIDLVDVKMARELWPWAGAL